MRESWCARIDGSDLQDTECEVSMLVNDDVLLYGAREWRWKTACEVLMTKAMRWRG